ncbi:27302_t:CDS:1, partial [Racocetra persica]
PFFYQGICEGSTGASITSANITGGGFSFIRAIMDTILES